MPPPSLPDPGSRSSAEELARYESVRLFAERAGAAGSGFALDDRNARAVARLCVGLDGMPPAIELAAARTRILSAEQILETPGVAKTRERPLVAACPRRRNAEKETNR